MDIVSFETAKKLKAAGFPEPEFACWQVWYNALGIGTFLGRKVLIGEKMHFSCYSLGSGRVMDMIVGHGDGTTFAPTATDILRELGHSSMFWDERKCGFSISTVDNINLIGWTVINNTNPAEAAALTWLSIHEKK